MSRTRHDGNHEAVRLLFELFSQRVLAAAFFVVRDEALAEDVMQETFVTAMQKLDQLKDPDKAGAWLTRIAVNKAHSLLRRNRRVVPLGAWAAPAEDAGEDLLREEERAQLHRALAALNEDHQLVLYLKYFQEMSVKNIAGVLEIPEGTVKSRLRRARELVNNYFSRRGGV